VFDILAPLAGRPMTQTDVEPVTWAIIQRGRAQTAVQHVSLMNAMRGLSREITADLMPYDVDHTSVLTQKPRPLGYWDMSEPDLDRYNAKWTDAVFMFPFNIAPLPAISLPLHWSADGLPICQPIRPLRRKGSLHFSTVVLTRNGVQEFLFIPHRSQTSPIY
jgi:amidase